jgi:Kef-type K+ transport system membrane component KefB
VPEEISFLGLFLVAMVAFASPLLLGLFPRIRIPDAVLEILLGILIGPAVLGWVEIDAPIRILAQIGLAFLLFLAGFEIDLHRLRGRTGQMAMVAFVFSVALALVAGFALSVGDLVETPLLVAVILVATALGLIVPVLRDAGQTGTDFGQLALAGASLAEFGAVVMLSLLFSAHPDTHAWTKVALLVGVAVVTVLVAVFLIRLERTERVSGIFAMYADTSAQIRVRAAMVLLLGFVALSEELGQEAILGAFLAGAVLRLADPDILTTHPQTLVKLEGLGFGFLIPVFFVATGLSFDLASLSDPFTLARVPLFLAVLLVVRGVPAVLYRRLVGGRRAIAAGLLQATSLTFIVAAAQIGLSLGRISSGTAAALIAAGLLSVVVFPPAALGLLRERGEEEAADVG